MLVSADLVGSSKNRKDGSVKSSIPIHSRFFSPPEMPRAAALPASVSAHCTQKRARSSEQSVWGRCGGGEHLLEMQRGNDLLHALQLAVH